MRSQWLWLKSVPRGNLMPLRYVVMLALITFSMWTVYKLQTQKSDFEHMHSLSYCAKSETFQLRLLMLASEVNAVLAENRIQHFLCYDTLWGQLLARAVFPWRAEVQMCVEEAHLERLAGVYKRLAQRGLEIDYNWHAGLYLITDPGFPGGSVQLIVFQEDKQSHWLRRTGWKYFRFNPDCTDITLHCFNPYLVDPPALEYARLGNYRFPVPHFGKNLQVFHYPHTWHLWEHRNGSIHEMIRGHC